jgi:HEAT repeat protein
MRAFVVVSLVLYAAQATPAEPARVSRPEPEKVRQLVRDLDDDCFDIRERAERDLARLGKEVIPLLEEELTRVESLEVRWRLHRLLDTLGGVERRVQPLLKQLADDRFSKRQEADEQLRRFGKEILPVLKKTLQTTSDLETRRRLNKIIEDLSFLP